MDTGDNYITSSTFTEGAVQEDGRRYIVETHTTEDQEYVYEYLCEAGLDPSAVLAERAKKVNEILHGRMLAKQAVLGTSVPITRYEFMCRLTPQERVAIRELSKVDPVVEDFMEMLKVSGNVSLVLVRPALSYIASKGKLTPERAQEIGAE